MGPQWGVECACTKGSQRVWTWVTLPSMCQDAASIITALLQLLGA